MSELGPRAKMIYEIVTETSFVSQNLAMLVKHVVEPLQIMSKGVTAGRHEEKFYQKSSKLGVLKQGAQILNGALEQKRLQAQSKALNSIDMANFFTSIITLDVCNEALVKALVACAREVEWSEKIAVGESIIDNIKNQRIESTLQVYATCLAPTRHTLLSSTFTTFVAGLENKLGMKTLPQHLESINTDVKRRHELLRKVRER